MPDDPILYSWPDPDGDGTWQIGGEPQDAWLERLVTRNDGEVVHVMPDTYECFDPLVLEVLRLAAQTRELRLTLVACTVPLEALYVTEMDGRALCEEVKLGIADAVKALRDRARRYSKEKGGVEA